MEPRRRPLLKPRDDNHSTQGILNTNMVLISRFRSVWGIDCGPGLSNWRKLLVEWKAHGYSKTSDTSARVSVNLTRFAVEDGIEVSIKFAAGSVEQLQALRNLCDEVDFEIAVVLVSTFPMISRY